MSIHIFYRCPICSGRAWRDPADHEEPQVYHCMRCGDFRVDRYFKLQFRNRQHSSKQVAKMSGYLRENSMTLLRPEAIELLENLRMPTVAERIAKLLRYLASENPHPGETIEIGRLDISGQLRVIADAELDEHEAFPPDPASESVCQKSLPLLSASWSSSQQEVRFLLDSLVETGQLRTSDNQKFEISPQGWKAIQERPEAEGSVCFVAMSFKPEFDPIWELPIRQGIEAAGYEPFRVDKKEHNDDITDEILAGIRTSKFVFADFTDQPGGVYYEAGFAAGLSKPVVRSVRKDQIQKLHFDTRQISHLVWEPENLEGFQNAISNRIVATIGRGPLKV